MLHTLLYMLHYAEKTDKMEVFQQKSLILQKLFTPMFLTD